MLLIRKRILCRSFFESDKIFESEKMSKDWVTLNVGGQRFTTCRYKIENNDEAIHVENEKKKRKNTCQLSIELGVLSFVNRDVCWQGCLPMKPSA